MNFCAYILKRSHTMQSQLKEKAGGEALPDGRTGSCRSRSRNSSSRMQQPSLAPKVRPFSFSLSPLPLSLFSLLNHCSNKLLCILSPFIHRRFSKPGSQQTPLSSWKRSASLLRNAWTPVCGSLHVYPSDQ